MKLGEYIKTLNDLIEENPKCLDFNVITSKDAEGNGYSSIYYGPTIGIFEDEEFIPKSQVQEWDRNPEEVNSVCLN